MNNQKSTIDIELLLKDLGLQDLNDEQKKQIEDLLMQNIQLKLEEYIVSIQTDEDAKLLENKSTEEVLIYFEDNKGVDFNVVMMTLALQCREELLQDVAYIKGMIDSGKK